MNSLIEINQFKKQYQHHLVIIRDLKINKRITLLVGKNGSGKSTLLKAIAHFISYEGTIKNNHKVCLMSETVTYPQDIDVITFLKHLNRISKVKSELKTIDNLLASFNLLIKKTELIRNLSKGMKVKINLLQCLMEKADIYLLDEPLSGLDKEGISQLITYIKTHQSNFIISTHTPNAFANLEEAIIKL